jgi:glycosyltransferase involved in cell wall biosynthesis
MKKKILVEGPILTQSGYGEHARFVMRSLKSQEELFDIYALPVNWGNTSWIFEDDEERRWFDSIINKTVMYVNQKGQFDIYVHVGIPNELKRKAPITIEVTAGIESNKVAPEWIDILNRECDKVVTVSEHSKDGLVSTYWKAQDQSGRVLDLKLNVPVEVVGYPVKQFNKYSEEYTKKELSLDYDFNFLCVAQWGPRKNLPNTIQWFLEEFKNDNVGLVCKVNNSNNSLLDKAACENAMQGLLKNFPDRKCKVYLLHGDLNHDEIHNLYVHPQIKAIINFGHGEGFGLPLFEAAYCGLPVIAPDYSGHKDFLYGETDGKIKPLFSRVSYELKKIQPEAVWNGVLHEESEWAYVKPLAAKLAMREIYKDYGRFKGQAKKLKEHLLSNEKNAYKNFCDIILGKVHLGIKDFNGVSFCIPTNGKRTEKTNLLLKSIRAQKGKPYEIIMCGDVESFRGEKDLILVDNKEDANNRKVASLRNKAAQNAKYDVIIWCDDDIVLDTNWLESFIEYNKNNGWNVLGNKILNPDGTRCWDRAILSREKHELVSYSESEGNPHLYQTSGFFAVRKEVWEKVKWDETKLVFADRENNVPEDLQYSFDLKNKGFVFHFNKDCTVWHNDERYTQFNNKTLFREVINKEVGFEIPFVENKNFTLLKENYNV